jgi:hypothetical protein
MTDEMRELRRALSAAVESLDNAKIKIERLEALLEKRTHGTFDPTRTDYPRPIEPDDEESQIITLN